MSSGLWLLIQLCACFSIASDDQEADTSQLKIPAETNKSGDKENTQQEENQQDSDEADPSSHESEEDQKAREELEAAGKERQEQQEAHRVAVLRELEFTMDPLIAAQVYNKVISPICRLPDELLLQIIDLSLAADVLALPCLWAVSQRFQRIITPMLNPRPYSSRVGDYVRKQQCEVQIEYTRRLQRDGMCPGCQSACDVVPEEAMRRFLKRRKCALGSWRDSCCLHCDSCDSHHFEAAFSASEREGSKRYRRCLARQGAVKLCDHVHISWDIIEAHVKYWQQRSPADWQACFDNFRVECRHPSHERQCANGENPSWPHARLQEALYRDNAVVLHLEWAPHSGFDAFTLSKENQASATALRSLFREYRRGPADNLFPTTSRNPLPEMGCFDPNKCLCVRYEMGSGKPAHTLAVGSRTIFRDRSNKPGSRYCCQGPFHQVMGRGHYGCGHNGSQITMSTHLSESGSACLVTKYEHDILVCQMSHRGKLNPSHWWSHAIDPATYPRPEYYALPECWDTACMNYRRKPQFPHCARISKIHWPCPTHKGGSCNARSEPLELSLDDFKAGHESSQG